MRGRYRQSCTTQLRISGFARQLSQSGATTDLRLAGIYAHSACELQTEKAFNDLTHRLEPEVRKAVLSLCGETFSLMDTRSRKLWRALTNDPRV